MGSHDLSRATRPEWKEAAGTADSEAQEQPSVGCRRMLLALKEAPTRSCDSQKSTKKSGHPESKAYIVRFGPVSVNFEFGDECIVQLVENLNNTMPCPTTEHKCG